jgi:hypothetical protein
MSHLLCSDLAEFELGQNGKKIKSFKEVVSFFQRTLAENQATQQYEESLEIRSYTNSFLFNEYGYCIEALYFEPAQNIILKKIKRFDAGRMTEEYTMYMDKVLKKYLYKYPTAGVQEVYATQLLEINYYDENNIIQKKELIKKGKPWQYRIFIYEGENLVRIDYGKRKKIYSSDNYVYENGLLVEIHIPKRRKNTIKQQYTYYPDKQLHTVTVFDQYKYITNKVEYTYADERIKTKSIYDVDNPDCLIEYQYSETGIVVKKIYRSMEIPGNPVFKEVEISEIEFF